MFFRWSHLNCLGVTFTHQPININERIHLKIIDVDETRQWCGSLAIGEFDIEKKNSQNYIWKFSCQNKIGFTQIDPSSIPQSELPKSALPNLGQSLKSSYVKRLYETLTKQLCIIFYYNPEWVIVRMKRKIPMNKNEFFF